MSLGILTLLGVVLDVWDVSVSRWFADHQFSTAAIAGGIELALVYLAFERAVARGEAQRWLRAAAEPLRVLAMGAEQMDRFIERSLSSDRSQLDRSSPQYRQAKAEYEKFAARLERNQALLTASPSMVEYLPVCVDLETYTRYLLLAPASSSDSLYIQWYDRAVWNFIAKVVEAVPITEISEPWLFRIPLTAYDRQIKHCKSADVSFLQRYREERRSRGLTAPPPLPGDE